MRVTVDGVALFFDVVGAGLVPTEGGSVRPTIVALHGGPGFDHLSFRPQLDALADVAQVVLVDFRGHGRSGGSPPDSSLLPSLAGEVIGFCEAVGIERPILWGESMGATVAIEVAVTRPELPVAVVMDAGAAHFDSAAAVRAFERRGGAGPAAAARAFFSDPSDETLRGYVAECLPYYLRDPRPAPIEGLLARLAPYRRSIFHWFGEELPAWDRRPLLSQVTRPILAAVGEHDCVFPPEVAKGVTACSEAEVIVVPGAGHPVLAEAPVELLAAARALIARTA